MTQVQAHEFLSKWSRRWLGRKLVGENEAIRRIKTSCLLLILQAVMPISLELPKLIYSPKGDWWIYVRIFIVTLSLLISIFSAWFLTRIYQSCKALNRKF